MRPDTPQSLPGSALTQLCGGPGGTSSLPLWHSASVPPGAFSLGPLQRPVLFSREKRMGGWKAPLLEGMRSAAFGRKDGLSRARGAEYSALGSAFERSAAFGRKEKLGPLCGKKAEPPIGGSVRPRLRRGKKTRPAGGGLRGGGYPLFQKELWKALLLGNLDGARSPYWGYLIAAWAAARRAMGTRKGEQDT